MLKLISLALVALSLSLIPTQAYAADQPALQAYGLNLKDFVDSSRAGMVLPFKGGKSLLDVYTALAQIHDMDGNEWATVNAGVAAYVGAEGKGYLILFPAARIDTIVNHYTNLGNWITKHVTVVKLPTLEVGAGVMLIGNKFIPAASLASKF